MRQAALVNADRDMKSRRKKILWLTFALACMALLRETGYLQVQSYRAHYEGRHLANKQLVYTRASGGQNVTASNADTTTDTNDDDHGWALGINSTVREPEKSESVTLAFGKDETYFTRALEEELTRTFKDKPSLQILISRLELSGAYWVPFFKQGTCSYGLALKEEGASLLKTRNLSGDIHFNMDGFCSVRDLEAELAKKIAKQAASPASDIQN
jgi:hypothetical protein